MTETRTAQLRCKSLSIREQFALLLFVTPPLPELTLLFVVVEDAVLGIVGVAAKPVSVGVALPGAGAAPLLLVIVDPPLLLLLVVDPPLLLLLVMPPVRAPNGSVTVPDIRLPVHLLILVCRRLQCIALVGSSAAKTGSMLCKARGGQQPTSCRGRALEGSDPIVVCDGTCKQHRQHCLAA